MKTPTSSHKTLLLYALLASVLALSPLLFGCSGNSTSTNSSGGTSAASESAHSGTVTAGGKEMSFDEFKNVIQGNELALRNDYIGKEISATSEVLSVSGPESVHFDLGTDKGYSHKSDKGFVEVGTDKMRLIVELTDETVGLASSLAPGDTVSVSGEFTGVDDSGYITKACILTCGTDGTPSESKIMPSISK